jgi:hypothetical protein
MKFHAAAGKERPNCGALKKLHKKTVSLWKR